MIIKNAMISREDIFPFMLKIAEEQDCLKKTRQYLISNYFGEYILINSKMAKFYLSMGLVITEIQEFVQLSPSECFKDLAQDIVNTRREGDKDSSKQILALTKKLLGNSFYSSSLLRKELL